VAQVVEGQVAVMNCALPGPGGELACHRVDRSAIHLFWTWLAEVMMGMLCSVMLWDLGDQAQ